MHLIDSFVDVLVYVQQQKKLINEGQQPAFEEVRLNVERLLTEKSTLHLEGGYQSEHYDEARFAVVAFIDEVLLDTAWQESARWAADLLQRNYYRTASAGIEFFDRLAGLNMIDPAHRDIREVYYYCLALGFSGRYFERSERASLERIRLDTYQLLMAGQNARLNDEGELLSPEAYPANSEQKTEVKSGRWTPFIFGVPVLVLVITYVAMKLDVVGMANQLVSLI